MCAPHREAVCAHQGLVSPSQFTLPSLRCFLLKAPLKSSDSLRSRDAGSGRRAVCFGSSGLTPDVGLILSNYKSLKPLTSDTCETSHKRTPLRRRARTGGCPQSRHGNPTVSWCLTPFQLSQASEFSDDCSAPSSPEIFAFAETHPSRSWSGLCSQGPWCSFGSGTVVPSSSRPLFFFK